MKTILFFISTLTGLSLFAQKTLGTDTIRWEGTALQAKIIVDTNVGNSDFIILDVRTPGEYVGGHIANSINIDYNNSATFMPQLNALDHNKMYLVHCASGGRSPKARDSMIVHHFREIYHMYNGISAWISAGFPTVTGYTFAEGADATNLTSLYPNPAKSILNVQFESASQGKLRIYDLKGLLLKEETLAPGLQVFDISDYPVGIYLVKIQSAEGVVSRKISIF